MGSDPSLSVVIGKILPAWLMAVPVFRNGEATAGNQVGGRELSASIGFGALRKSIS
jgi:hypothetical protein